MSEPLFEVIAADLQDGQTSTLRPDNISLTYLSRLSSLPLRALTSTETEALEHDLQSVHGSLGVLAKREYKSSAVSDEQLSHVQTHVPQVVLNASIVSNAIPYLESNANKFAEKYSRLTDNAVLDRRKRALKLNENVDRLSSIMELPTLLSSIVSSSNAAANSGASMSSANASYTTALDLHAHIKRLQNLYPNSALVSSIAAEAETTMKEMTSNLIATLRSNSLKLAGSMRLISLLRRVAPELDDESSSAKPWSATSSEGSFGLMFLVCRLSNLSATLSALEPLQELADQEFTQSEETRQRNLWAAGQQTERYLKRFIEVFREQCFATVSMYKSVFPTSLAGPSTGVQEDNVPSLKSPSLRSPGANTNGDADADDAFLKLPPAIATFVPHIVDLLMDTLRKYMPNVCDRASRDSLLTQVLYCSASLGRLGGDFGMMLALLEDDDDEDENSANDATQEPEWVSAMKKHRVQAGRLEMLATGVGERRTVSASTNDTAAVA